MKTSEIKNSKLKTQSLWLAIAFFSLMCFPDVLSPQEVPDAPDSDTGQIKKDLHKNKKNLAAIEKKIEEQKKQKQLRMK